MSPHIEHPCDLHDPHNIAIALSYFSVGLAQSFISTPLNIYLVETLNAEPAMQNTINILCSLPWSFKLLFGFISDAFPILGMHRKPYLASGMLVYSFCYVFYGVLELNNSLALALCLFIGTMGLIQLDVMCDTMCVERSKFENLKNQGQMQASCYSIRFGGTLFGSFLGASVCNKVNWGWGLTFHQVAFYNGLIPLLLIAPFIFTLREKYYAIDNIKPFQNIEENNNNSSTAMSTSMTTSIPNSPSPKEFTKLKYKAQSFYDTSNIEIFEEVEDELQVPDHTRKIQIQVREIWLTVQLQAVWKPMAFVYLYNIFQIPNIAWQSYLQLSLHFEPWILGLMVSAGSSMTFFGILGYKYIFFRASWRSIYIYSTLVTTLFSLLQICLIFQINTKLGISNYLFSLGDDVISAYISGIQFLPVCIMYMRLCPEGAEGSSYAMLTTFGNIALTCAANIGNHLASIWDVSNEAMKTNNIDGLWKLTLLTSCLSLFPLTMIHLLPLDAEHQEKLSRSKERSVLGGVMFLVVLGISLSWSIFSAIRELLAAWQ